jgi:arginine exporter protein ArgO
MSLLTAFAAGLAAGLGVAMPLGGIGLLVIEEGIRRGWRFARAAASSIAGVDVLYAGIAVCVGTGVATVFEEHERAIRIGGAVALLVVAGLGLSSLFRSRSDDPQMGALPTSIRATVAKFAILTLANPLTLIYFAVLAAGIADRLDGPAASIAFVAGIGLASFGWQLGLGGLGATAGRVIGPTGRRILSLAGFCIVVSLAFLVLLG